MFRGASALESESESEMTEPAEFDAFTDAQHDRGLFHFRRAAFSSQLKSRIGNILAKAAALRVNLILDGAPIISRTHTHPSHSQTSRLLI
jgi:hypothetical protein